MLACKKILVATDFSPPARVALRSGQALAKQVGGTLEVVHVVERLPPRRRMLLSSFGTPGGEAERLCRAEAHLERLLGRVGAPRVAVEGGVRLGRPSEQILEAAREVEADLVCLGNSGHSRFQRLLLGSTAENVVRRSPIPVLVTRRQPLGRIGSALLPVDFSEGAAATVGFAARRLPRAHGWRLSMWFRLRPQCRTSRSIRSTRGRSKSSCARSWPMPGRPRHPRRSRSSRIPPTPSSGARNACGRI